MNDDRYKKMFKHILDTLHAQRRRLPRSAWIGRMRWRLIISHETNDALGKMLPVFGDGEFSHSYYDYCKQEISTPLGDICVIAANLEPKDEWFLDMCIDQGRIDK